MFVRYEPTGSIEALQKLLDEMAAQSTVTAIMILACDRNGFLPENVNTVLQQTTLPIFGGIFPGVIYGKYKYDKGTILVGFDQPVEVAVINRLDDDYSGVKSQIANSFNRVEKADTMFVFIDGYAMHIWDFLSELEKTYPESGDYIGGGTGSAHPLIRGEKITSSIFTNQGLMERCAVVAHAAIKCGIGVSHGFEPVEGPFQVTSKQGNALLTLDGEPAVKMYNQLVSLHSGQQLCIEDTANYFNAYPLGLITPENGFVVRDLLAVHGNELITATYIPDGEFVYLVTGDKDALIGAASEATKEALTDFGENNRSLTMLVECISRAFFLGNDLARELSAISTSDQPVIGFLSLGEIAKHKESHVVFYNKTCVMGILGE